MKRLNATSLDDELTDPGGDRTMSRRKKQIAPRSGKVLDEPRFSPEQVEMEVGESEEWDEASQEK